ncbi:GNAT family N-acetyltransferase [Sediminibacterium ginsengisoli]|uniref:L-amino acid N-acyltransferase YncA n=1 Tax=Sediminibacterium ginsengisoli TaxID=413434 RepID=A0A1T4PHY6_9BACT|nr:GNAT family N-acetyltransferase [Sediminibacterium ginsengisoli]SJZ91031.1 L-amino acid N-acyltransferase YncA [Sediminibacterium ginsengisoli]
MSIPALSIREAGVADIESIRQIAFATWPSAYGNIISQEQISYMMDMMYSPNVLEEQMNKNHLFYMAELDGQPHGFAGVSDEGAGIFKLNKLYVMPDTQKTGAGKALLAAAIGYARSKTGNTLILQVNRHNPARGFYEKQGFTVREDVDIHVGNGFYMNDHIMEFAL